MKSAIVLTMHGAPPLDFPGFELGEFFRLQARGGHGEGHLEESARRRREELEKKIREWPRTPQNDPFYAGSMDLAENLRRETGFEVILGFNEFCSPTLDQALDRAAEFGAERIIVVTPMMTRGGEHSTVDIPSAVERAKQRHPGKNFIYAWPFPTRDIASFLASQVKRYL